MKFLHPKALLSTAAVMLAVTTTANAMQLFEPLGVDVEINVEQNRFLAADSNHDKVLTEQEILEYRVQHFRKLDRNNDQKITRDEFILMPMQGTAPATQAQKENMEQMQVQRASIFSMLDSNDDDAVTLQEYNARSREWYAIHDQNRDGRLTYAEHQTQSSQMASLKNRIKDVNTAAGTPGNVNATDAMGQGGYVPAPANSRSTSDHSSQDGSSTASPENQYISSMEDQYGQGQNSGAGTDTGTMANSGMTSGTETKTGTTMASQSDTGSTSTTGSGSTSTGSSNTSGQKMASAEPTSQPKTSPTAPARQATTAPQASKQQMALFDRLDTDNSNSLSRQEILIDPFQGATSENMTAVYDMKAERAALFTILDKDGNGQISKQEFGRRAQKAEAILKKSMPRSASSTAPMGAPGNAPAAN